MILIEVNKKHYEFYNEWKDLTIRRTLEWAKADVPKALIGAMDAIPKDGIKGYFEYLEKCTAKERNKEIPTYIGVMMKTFTDIPDDVMEHIDGNTRTEFFHNYLIEKMLDVRLMSRLQLQDIKSFDFDGVTYHLPKIGKAINGESMGVDLLTINFAESSDMATYADELKGGKVEALPYMLAALCRVDGEQYSEQGLYEKAEKFLELDMQTAWEVYFFMLKCLTILQSGMADFFTQKAATLEERLRRKRLELIKQGGKGKSMN